MRFIETGDGGNLPLGTGNPGPEEHWPTSLLRRWTDRRHLRAECQRALALYERVRDERPDLRGRPLYQEIVRRCAGGAADRASSIVRHAEDSFATWPAGRDVRFRDVVAYIVIDELLLGSRGRGVRSDVEAVVASTIPARL